MRARRFSFTLPPTLGAPCSEVFPEAFEVVGLAKAMMSAPLLMPLALSLCVRHGQTFPVSDKSESSMGNLEAENIT